MKLSFFGKVLLALVTGMVFQAGQVAQAATSPYVTTQTDVPLNQSTTDTVNGVLPYFNSHTPLESGSVATLTDAATATTPTGNVILGPDNTWVGVAWDFGEPPAGHIWRLDRFDAWISAGDNLRKGYDADISYSSTGEINDFTVIPNSRHEAGFTQNSQYNYVRYDFPAEFVDDEDDTKDKHVITGFRYLRLNSRGEPVGGSTDWQTRFVEVDIWVTAIPVPSETPVFSSVERDSNGNVTLKWSAIAGRTYNVEYRTDLSESTWSPLDTVVATSDSETLVDPSTSAPERYYRVTLMP